MSSNVKAKHRKAKSRLKAKKGAEKATELDSQELQDTDTDTCTQKKKKAKKPTLKFSTEVWEQTGRPMVVLTETGGRGRSLKFGIWKAEIISQLCDCPSVIEKLNAWVKEHKKK